MTTQDALWIAAASSLLVALTAAIADRRRNGRRNLDRIGWVPWNFVQIAAAFAAVICAGFAIKL